MLGWGVLGLIAWILVAFWPARVASKKGHSFIGWFIISLFFWWISLFWVYLGMKDTTRTAKDDADDAAVERAMQRDIDAANK